MNKIDELMQELCPDGVQYNRLSDVVTLQRGVRVVRNQLATTGDIPVYQNSLTPMGYHSESNFPAGTTFVICAGAAGEIGFSDVDFWAADDCTCVVCSDKLMGRYVYHFLLSQQAAIRSQVRKASIPRLSKTSLEKLLLPVPPIEVQREIVRILDNYTEQVEKLKLDLAAEIEARKKQYEYYRDLLLTFGVNGGAETRSDIKQMKLRDIATSFRGEYITKKGTKPGTIPVILGGQEPAYYIDKSNHNGEIVVIARSGASAGFVSFWNQPIFVTDGFGYEAKSGVTIPKFLFYILKNREAEMNNMKRGAGVPHVSGEALEELVFLIPSIAEQLRLVSILERFDNICNSLTSGLPAEIAARQKQYEYYRDKLLTFEVMN